jgi:hypothetical protein
MKSMINYHLKIDKDDINWRELSCNPSDGAYELLYYNKDKIDWGMLSKNCNDRIIDLLYQNKDKIRFDTLITNTNNRAISMFNHNFYKINFFNLSSNPCDESLNILEKYKNKIHWGELCFNTNYRAIQLLKEKRRIDWGYLCYNTNPDAISLIEENIEKDDVYPHLSWEGLSMNKNAIDILLQNKDKVNPLYFSKNSNDKALYILKNNPKIIDYLSLAVNCNEVAINIVDKYLHTNKNNMVILNLFNNKNPRAVDIILKNNGIVNYKNPGIFKYEYNYPYIRDMYTFKEDLIAKVWNPTRYDRWPEDPFVE